MAEIVRTARNTGQLCRLAIGYFDPLLAGHARRLRDLKTGAGLLVVLVDSPETPLLPAPARAGLAAGLQAVDYVVVRGDGDLELITAFPESDIAIEKEADAARTRQLARRVHERQRN